jgi:hypothetical protein
MYKQKKTRISKPGQTLVEGLWTGSVHTDGGFNVLMTKRVVYSGFLQIFILLTNSKVKKKAIPVTDREGL